MANKKDPVFMLTTVDNPYNPFEEWIPWYMQDIKLGHDTCGLLARMCFTADGINDEAELYAMRRIVKNNFSGKHIIVTQDTFDELIKLPVD